MWKKLTVLAVGVCILPAWADKPADTAIARMRADLTFLASDACEGRGPGTEGIDKAGAYIAAAFEAAGLKGAAPDGSFFQPFQVRGNPTLKPGASLAIKGPDGEPKKLALNDDFQALGLSGSGMAAGPIVFAGYGITCDTPAYDDYHGIDVTGKIVLLIRKAPRFNDKDHPFADDQTVQRHAALQTKIANAEKHKAAAVILVNDAGEKDDPLMDFAYASGAAGNIPAAQIKRGFADQMLNSALNKSLTDVEEAIAKDLTPASAPLKGWSAMVSITVSREKIAVKNVVGILEGAGPLAKETVVVGAHYDHLGYGGSGSGSLAGGVKAIHHGADDNGSGTTALMELARRFGAPPPNPPPPGGEGKEGRRRLVFIAFSGEEMGLLGSQHYVDHPLFPLDSTVAMVNMDMVGRLAVDEKSGKSKLEVGGTGSAKEFDGLIDKLNAKYEFDVKKNKSGVGPSDHTSFYLKGVPVFFLFTGLHKQYHKPTDTVDLINFAGMERIADLAEDLTRRLATESARPEYVKGVGSMFSGGSLGNTPRLGFMPGNYDDDADGVLIGSVTKDGPADKGGVKDGDRIVAVAGEPIKNMTMYMQVMGKQKRKQPVEITVDRKGDKVKLTVTPQ
jgi:Zn-dependent M28 family amino/carboxypeptidase